MKIHFARTPMILLAALITYHQGDPGFFYTGDAGPVRNAVGLDDLDDDRQHQGRNTDVVHECRQQARDEHDCDDQKHLAIADHFVNPSRDHVRDTGVKHRSADKKDRQHRDDSRRSEPSKRLVCR